MIIAITRQVSPSINQCELTYLERKPIDLERANDQHRVYEDTLRSLGVQINSLPAELNLPDSVFIEDTAIVLPEIAVVTRPGVISRRAETQSVAKALAPYRKIIHIQAPGTLDGGDVLCIEKNIYIGRSARSNDSGIDQIREFVSPYGYQVNAVEISHCLHLKSAVTQVDEGILLINPAWIDKSNFPKMKMIEVDASEFYAANALQIKDSVIYPSAYPKTVERLIKAGMHLVLVDVSELLKAEGAVTCCSLIINE